MDWSFIDNYEWLENYGALSIFGAHLVLILLLQTISLIFREKELKEQRHLGLLYVQNKKGTIADSGISKAKDKYGNFAPEGSEILSAKSS